MSYASEANPLDRHAATQSDSPADSSADLGIREFARHYGHSEAEVRRAMRQLAVSGSSPGRGRPTRLSPEEQERILDYIEGPEESATAPVLNGPVQHAPVQHAPLQHTPVQNVPIQDIPHWDEPHETAQAAPGGLEQNRVYGAGATYADVPEVAYSDRHPLDPSSLGRNAPISGYSAAEYPGGSEYPSQQGQLQISAGNHRTTLTPPPLPQSYDLAQFRSPEPIPAIADPGEVANQAMAAIDALVSGMEADIRQQRHQLQETQNAAQALRLKAKHLQDKKLEYMIQSTAIGQSQQRCTAEIQEALGEVHALGKLPRSEQEPPSP